MVTLFPPCLAAFRLHHHGLIVREWLGELTSKPPLSTCRIGATLSVGQNPGAHHGRWSDLMGHVLEAAPHVLTSIRLEKRRKLDLHFEKVANMGRTRGLATLSAALAAAMIASACGGGNPVGS